jgi:hypothetical protein
MGLNRVGALVDIDMKQALMRTKYKGLRREQQNPPKIPRHILGPEPQEQVVAWQNLFCMRFKCRR